MNGNTVTDPSRPGEPRRLPAFRLDLLDTFIVIAEERCLARAADRLYVSPSGVTRRLQALEKELGQVLVDRQSKTLVLTPAGHALLPHAESIVKAAEGAIEAVRNAPDLRIVREQTRLLSSKVNPRGCRVEPVCHPS